MKTRIEIDIYIDEIESSFANSKEKEKFIRQQFYKDYEMNYKDLGYMFNEDIMEEYDWQYQIYKEYDKSIHLNEGDRLIVNEDDWTVTWKAFDADQDIMIIWLKPTTH